RAVRADAALFGSVTRQSAELVIQPRLLEVKAAASDTVSLDPVTVPEGELLAKIAGLPVLYARALKVSLTAAETARVERAALPTRSLRAFELFARGAIALQRSTQEGNEAAVDLLARAIETDPNFVVAHYTLGAVHQTLGNRWKAAAQFRASTQLDAAYPEPFKALGDLFLAAPRRLFDQAVEAYNKAIGLDPQLVEARMGLGEVYEEKGLYKEAVEEYKRVIDVESAHTGALYNLALVYEKIDPREAIAQWERYIELASPLQSEKDW